MTDADFNLRRLRQMMSADLDEERPDRYTVADTTDEDAEDDHPDMGWIDEVGDRYASQLPQKEIRKLYARNIAHSIESTNLRRGNQTIRDALCEQVDLGWLDRANYPVMVVHRIVKKGERPKVRRERVRVAAMSARDLRLFASEERKNAAKDFETRNRTCRIAEEVADEMDAGEYTRADEWWRGRFGDSKSA